MDGGGGGRGHGRELGGVNGGRRRGRELRREKHGLFIAMGCSGWVVAVRTCAKGDVVVGDASYRGGTIAAARHGVGMGGGVAMYGGGTAA